VFFILSEGPILISELFLCIIISNTILYNLHSPMLISQSDLFSDLWNYMWPWT